jgi:hypothetical protein
MTDGGYALLVHRRLPGPSEAEHAELAQLRERFRSHHIFCDAPRGRGVRYLACRTVSGVRPHTIITDDLAELRYELEQAAPGELALSKPLAGMSCRSGATSPDCREIRNDGRFPEGHVATPTFGIRHTQLEMNLRNYAHVKDPQPQVNCQRFGQGSSDDCGRSRS